MDQGASTNRQNLAAIALMTAGMAATASVDAVIKGASEIAAPAQIIAVVGFGIAVICSSVLLARREKILVRGMSHPAVISRTFFEIVGSFGTVLALGMVTLTVVTTIGQTVPILVTLGAIAVFKERPRPSDWLALFGGLSGMLLIVGPGAQGFDSAALVAVVAAIGLAARDLSSRGVPGSVTTAHLGVLGGLALGLTGVLLMIILPGQVVGLTLPMTVSFAAIVGFAALAFFCITSAMRIGNVSVVSPFRYARLVFGVALGVILFGDTIDVFTAAGAILIVACGLFLLRAEFG